MTGSSTRSRMIRILLGIVATVLVVLIGVRPDRIQGQSDARATESDSDPIWIEAEMVQEWENGAEKILILRGNCRISQGGKRWQSRSMVIWTRSVSIRDRRQRVNRVDSVTVFLEDEVRTQRPGRTVNIPNLLIDLETSSGVQYRVGERFRLPGDQDPLFDRAKRRRRLSQRQTLTQTQLFVEDETVAGQRGPSLPPLPAPASSTEMRRVRIFPRSSRFFVESFQSSDTTPAEQIWVVKGGVNLLIDGIIETGVVDLSADRMVIWTQTMEKDQELRSESLQSRDTPFQVYMEGNIVVRQGTHVLRASRAYYDAREDRALMLNAEMKSFIPQLQGDVRIRAERIRQLSRRNFHAQRAWATASQFGKPGYRLQASDVFLDYRPQNPWIGTPGTTAVDPATGAPLVQEIPWIQSLNNQFLIEDVPIFFSPSLSTPAEDPNIPIRRAAIEQDSIFGTQIRTVWDLSKLTGLELPPGVEWNLDADYLSKRGPAIGTSGRYEGQNPFGMPGSYRGQGLLYYIHDSGTDNLGLDRRALVPPSESRGQARIEHRQELPNRLLLFGELGYLSDRNFLEQYDENAFDEAKDAETLLYLKQDRENWSWSVLGRPQLNDFEVTTEWLPRLDIFGFSEPLFGSLINWTSHASLGYGRLRQAAFPTDPNDLFIPIPYAADADGAVLMTRHELDVPFSLGAVHFDPYVRGEAAYWSEDLAGNEVDRLVGTAGLRASLMAWRVFPGVCSRILNLNGLAHKAVFTADYAFTDSNRSLDEIPQYNEFDDNSQERFRERLVTNTFGGVLPTVFDPRAYAVRTGAASWVSSPYHELVDSQQVLRLSMRHRLQTKVGPADRLRIEDVMVLDTGVSFFPRPDRDNFGEDWGLIYGNYQWNFSDRTKLLASGLYDLFEGGQEIWSLGALSQRSTRGSVYLGVRQVKGSGLESQILTASYSYAMGPKWISTFGTAYDLAEGQNRGQSLTMTRVGADFLFHFGTSYDSSKDNAGIAIAIEPRFGALNSSSTQLSNLLGFQQ